MRPVATFSIVARDPTNGDLGVATASKFLAVGAVVPYAKPGHIAVATQSYANPAVGPLADAAVRHGVTLERLRDGFAASDPEHHLRQYGLVTADGASLSFTGSGCHPWAGGRSGEGWAAQGNLLTGPEVVDAVIDVFLATDGALADRLLAALSAGDQAGGDARGRQAAALVVVREGGGYGGSGRLVDLRVDDDEDPVGRLGDLLRLHHLYFGHVDPATVLSLEGQVADRALRGLIAAGHLDDGHDGWDAAAEMALRSWAGVENLEERMVERGSIDPQVLEALDPR